MKNVPKLRFKEFSSEWQAKKTSSLLQRVSNPVAVKSDKEYQQIGIRSHGKGIFHKELVTGAELGNKRVFWVEENTFVVNIVFAWEQAVAKTSSAEKGMIASHRFPMYKAKENEADINYIFRLFLTDKGRHYLGLASPGGAGRNKTLGQKNFEELDIIVPDDVKEQTKIADFLTAIDDRISQLSQKCDGLAQYKKGVMQKIFSQELRFKDEKGRAFPAWDSVDLGNLAFKVNTKNKDDSLSKVLTNSAVQGIVSQNDFFDKDIANKNNLEGYYVVELNDFVYNPRISSSAPVGPIKRNKLAKGVMSPLYTVFRFKSGCLDFLEYFFETTYWHDHMKSVSNMGARFDRMNITNEGFFALPIALPSIAEQEKIAGFLSAVDEKISQAQAQLAALKQYKQGLLQQMFV